MAYRGDDRPRLVLLCGLPGAGKSTLALRLEAEMPALRLCPDEWMVALGVDLWDDIFRGLLEKQMWRLAQELLASRRSVILDYGQWSRSERDDRRLRARALGVGVELRFLDVEIEELERRLVARNYSSEWIGAPITRAHLEAWRLEFEPPGAAELALFDPNG